MKRFLLLFNLTFVVVFVSSEVFGQQLTEGTKPTKSDLEGFGEGDCSLLPSQIRICEVLMSKQGVAKYFIQVNNQTVRSIEVPSSGTANGFATYRGDLDKDGVPELILVSIYGVSNGMGVSHSMVYIFRDPIRSPNAGAVSIPIKEFGGNETFVFDQKLQRILLLVTYWRYYETLDKRRGSGLYLVGKWFIYQKGKLKPLFDRPTLARRFLYRFQNERSSNLFEKGTPYQWLRDRTTHRFYREPTEGRKSGSTELGIVSTFSTSPEEGCKIEIKTSGGKTIVGLCFGSIAEEKGKSHVSIADIGIWKYRYCFPYDFDPSFFFRKVIGKRVKLENHIDEYGNKYTDLWFIGE